MYADDSYLDVKHVTVFLHLIDVVVMEAYSTLKIFTDEIIYMFPFYNLTAAYTNLFEVATHTNTAKV